MKYKLLKYRINGKEGFSLWKGSRLINENDTDYKKYLDEKKSIEIARGKT